MHYWFFGGSRSGDEVIDPAQATTITQAGWCRLPVAGQPNLSEIYILNTPTGEVEYYLTLGTEESPTIGFSKAKDPCPYCGGTKTKTFTSSPPPNVSRF